MTLLKDIKFISKQQPMPTNNTAVSASVKSVTGETVSLYYSLAGVRTIDAGQAAGTPVVGQLANKNILDVSGGYIATAKDSSLSFTGLCFTNQVKFNRLAFYELKDGTWAAKLAAITASMSNGDYCVDYESGTIYGLKATTASSLTSTAYSCNQNSIDTELPAAAALADATANPTTPAVGTFVHSFNGTTWDRKRSGQTASSTTVTGFDNTLPMLRYNASPTVRTEGQIGMFQGDAYGNVQINKATLDAGESQSRDRQFTEEPVSVNHITTATTTTVLTGAGTLKKIIINKAIAAGVITIYDNTAASGTVLGIITIGAALLNDPPLEWAPESAIITTGITIVTSAAFDLTVCYDAT